LEQVRQLTTEREQLRNAIHDKDAQIHALQSTQNTSISSVDFRFSSLQNNVTH